MTINAYGNPSDPAVILLAPLLVSGEDIYSYMSPFFTGSCYFIAPDQGGHGKAGNYVSLEAEYNTLKQFLSEKGIRKITLLYGASLGASTAYRLFTDPGFEIECMWLDGVILNKNAGIAEKYMSSMFKNQKKKMAETHREVPVSLIRSYGPDLAKLMAKNLKRLTQKDVDAISHACCHCDLKTLGSQVQKKIHLDFGEKDYGLTYSKKALPVYMPGAELVIRKGFGHCEYMAGHMKEYMDQVLAFMEKNRR